MGDDEIDPASLDGDALAQWYTRSPDEIEQARQAAYTQRYNAFFGGAAGADPDPGFSRGMDQPATDVDPGFSSGMDQPATDVDPGFSRGMDTSGEDVNPGFTWIQDGPNRFRSVPATSATGAQMPSSPSDANDGGAVLDKGLAGPDDGAEIIDVGNPANPRLRREHAAKYGAWPIDPITGRNYDVAHIIAKADGGTDTLENIRPMHPDDHRAEHMNNGDFARWGARSGGKVASSAPTAGSVPINKVPHVPSGEIPRFKAPGLGLISPLSDILGMISGRIRTDSLDNFSSDMMGWPSQEDIRRNNENIQKQLFPQAKPGEIWV
jgi:hypothetical protein